MEIIYSEKAKKDILFWKKSGNASIQHKISALLDDMGIHLFFWYWTARSAQT